MGFPDSTEEIGLDAFRASGLLRVQFPKLLKTVSQGAFAQCDRLVDVAMNEGLETLGTNEYRENGTMCIGVFQESALESVSLPSTLKRIEYRAFMRCGALREIDFPE